MATNLEASTSMPELSCSRETTGFTFLRPKPARKRVAPSSSNCSTMRFSRLVIQLVVCGQLTSAFSPMPPVALGRYSVSQQRRRDTRCFSSQWDEEDDDDVATSTSFEDAGVALQQEEDEKNMAATGNRENPNVRTIA